MGYYVGVQLSFPCDSSDKLRQVATQTLNAINDVDFDISYTKRMLSQIMKDTERYIHLGNKGDMFIWGGVWNAYMVENELPFLSDFLLRCWAHCDTEESILFDFERALLLINREQTEILEIYEFSLNEEGVVTRNAKTDLCWNQY